MVSSCGRFLAAWLGLGFSCLMLTGCLLNRVDTDLVQGNYAYARGDYQQAMVHYLAALQNDTVNRAWIQYDLGNVYFSLGEVEAAARMWDQAARAEDQDLLFAVHFNQGIAFYRQGNYPAAFEVFRQVLQIRPASHEAKINLELAQRKLQAADRLPVVAPAGTPPLVAADINEGSRLLEFVVNKEALHWQAGKPAVPSAGGANW